MAVSAVQAMSSEMYVVIGQQHPPDGKWMCRAAYYFGPFQDLEKAKNVARDHADDQVDCQVDGWRYRGVVYLSDEKGEVIGNRPHGMAEPIYRVFPSKKRAKEKERLWRLHQAIQDCDWDLVHKLKGRRGA